MMNYYREITLLPDTEIPLSFLWTKIFTQIHLALVEQKEKSGKGLYGLSFPQYQAKQEKEEGNPDEAEQEESEDKAGLGTKIRLFADTQEELEALPLDKYLRHYGDYVHVTRARPVPERRIKGYASYSRYQPDGSKEAKARRYARRHDISYAKALRVMKRKKETYTLPFIQIHSLSNGHGYNLFIRKEERKEPAKGTFSSYGLSPIATVPEF